MITIKTNAESRTGTVSGPIAGNAAEYLTVTGVSVGTAVALLSPDGDTLAHAVCESENGLVTLNTATRECVEYLSPAAVGAGYPAVIAVGDTNNLIALVRCTVVRNWLAGIAPPAESAPIYPTSAELRELLAAMQAAQKAVADTAAETARQQNVITQQIADAGKILTDIGSAKTETLSAISDAATAATQAVTAAETEILAEITRARAETSEALVAVGNSAASKVTAAADTALQSVTAAQTDAVTAVTTAKTYALKSVTDAGTAISQKIAAAGVEIDVQINKASSAAGAADTAATRAERAADRAENALALVPVIADEAAATLEAARTLTGVEETPVSPLLRMTENL